ncbi:hypothetical protein FDO65_09275 [Nakamurella flava]|uniref:Lipoprotein n=1 Tax=Nakamurella flava TaxID=2576308 RepID=A0A4U6QMR4_9ACTN|nr:hypothetical protein [Nakamurella flava]TKV61721.1 hypothetical protein FDO65_09275 [Nakamurella flava]
MTRRRPALPLGVVALTGLVVACAGPATAAPGSDAPTTPVGRNYPWHTDIVATTFWVGEVFDPTAEDGSQVYSTYDAAWMVHYGGCDGVVVDGVCGTEPRSADNDWFPTAMTPLENPFYLDLPFDDVNDAAAFARRGAVIPWAHDPPYRDLLAAGDVSLMKNRWVQIRRGDRSCYAQIQDAGPGQYDDADYVFGSDDRRPLNQEFNGAGMDVSPAVNGCLGFTDLNGENDRVDWRFVDDADVPVGPWRNLVTTSGVTG